MVYENEQALVDNFTSCLESNVSPWGAVEVSVEFFYQRGKTDVVAVADDGEVIAFEAKLTKWRDALHQAYRNTCYAHRSYIVLPEKVARKASYYEIDFAQRKVGLCFISNGSVIIIYDAPLLEPLQPWLNEKATLATKGTGTNASTTDGESCTSYLRETWL